MASYGYAVRRLWAHGSPAPAGWEVFRPGGHREVPDISATCPSYAAAVTLQHLLNAVHPDAMLPAMKAGASAVMPMEDM